MSSKNSDVDCTSINLSMKGTLSDSACSVMFEFMGKLKNCSFFESQRINRIMPYILHHRCNKNVRVQVNLKNKDGDFQTHDK